MNLYSVHILKYADWFAPGTTVFDHAYGRHDPVKICLAGFLVRGMGRTLMIDTGMDGIDATYTTADRIRWKHLGPSRNTADLLADFGLNADDVDTVAITHLHFDHYVNAPLYRRAQFFVSAQEWNYVRDPANRPGCPEVGFPRGPLDWLAGQGARLVLTNDGQEIAPGITMHWTGGHSPGHMVVKVPTSQGTVIIVGDAFYLYEHLESDIPLGYRTNLSEVLAGYRWLRQQEAILLPAHDYALFDRHPSFKIG
ncbi:MAG: N-acyl homoserine lactonase family protein [Opitutaceae bacterium]|nr:N-acyl homoserine lactonase family protein [Opitutaceae bacterium]